MDERVFEIETPIDQPLARQLATQRVVPKQGRARRRIASILDATEILLAQNSQVTTSTIAKQAGIPVGSIYRYFPNVMGIYAALFARLNDHVDAKIMAMLAEADATADASVGWRVLFRQLIGVIGDGYREYPTLGVLLRMSSSPELAPISLASKTNMVEIIEQRFRDGRNGFQHGDPIIVANTVIELISWFEIFVFANTQAGAQRDVLYAEGVRVIEAYLSLYFPD